MPVDPAVIDELRRLLQGTGAGGDPRLGQVTQRPNVPYGSMSTKPPPLTGFSFGGRIGEPSPLPPAGGISSPGMAGPRPPVAPPLRPEPTDYPTVGTPNLGINVNLSPIRDALFSKAFSSLAGTPGRASPINPYAAAGQVPHQLPQLEPPPEKPIPSAEGVPPMLAKPEEEPELSPEGVPYLLARPEGHTPGGFEATPSKTLAAPKGRSFGELLFGGGDVGKLRNMRDIAEGLGNIRVRTGAGIRAGIDLSPPLRARGIEERIGEVQDELSSETAKSLEDYFGFKVPPGMKFSQLKSVLPGVASVAGRRESAGLARQNRLDMFNLAKQERLEREQRAQEFKKQQAARLAPTQITSIDDLDRTIAHAKLVIQEKPKYWTGPIDSRVHDVASWVGLEGAEKGTFKQTLNIVLNDYINNLSGKAVTAQEAQRLREALPRWHDNDSQFMARAKRFLYMLELDRDIYLGNLEKAGKDVTNWAEGADEGLQAEGGAEAAGEDQDWGLNPAPGGMGGAPTGGGGKRAIIGPNGETGNADPNEDLSKYPGWRWK